MGWFAHDAIIVTADLDVLHHQLDLIRAHAISLGLTVTEIVKSPTNHFGTFVVVPDGSKEDWPESTAGDKAREMFVNFLRMRREREYVTEWVEVHYADQQGGGPYIVDSSLKKRRRE